MMELVEPMFGDDCSFLFETSTTAPSKAFPVEMVTQHLLYWSKIPHGAIIKEVSSL